MTGVQTCALPIYKLGSVIQRIVLLIHFSLIFAMVSPFMLNWAVGPPVEVAFG